MHKYTQRALHLMNTSCVFPVQTSALSDEESEYHCEPLFKAKDKTDMTAVRELPPTEDKGEKQMTCSTAEHHTHSHSESSADDDMKGQTVTAQGPSTHTPHLTAGTGDSTTSDTPGSNTRYAGTRRPPAVCGRRQVYRCGRDGHEDQVHGLQETLRADAKLRSLHFTSLMLRLHGMQLTCNQLSTNSWKPAETGGDWWSLAETGGDWLSPVVASRCRSQKPTDFPDFWLHVCSQGSFYFHSRPIIF